MTDKTRENLTNAIRPLVRELMDNPNVTDEDLAAMGLPPRDTRGLPQAPRQDSRFRDHDP